MFELDLKSEPQLHKNVASLISDAQDEILAVYDKHRAKHKKYRTECEKRALAGSAEALKQYRQMIRIEQTWRLLKNRLLQDISLVTKIARPR